jgi:energy-coupling factor transporter transmembrane protein EcfT
VGSKIALIPSLALVIIPRIAKDSEDTFNTLRLRGEIQGGFYRWLPKTLAILIASVIYRSEFLAQSLYFRGFGIQKRTHYRKIKMTWMDVSRLVIWITFLALFIIFNYYGTLNFFI